MIVSEVLCMSKKEDLREKIEEHRQSIEIEEETSRLSRSNRKKKKNKQHKFPLMTTLTFILIGIPLMILIYVWGFYTPDEPEVAKDKEDNPVLEIQKNSTASASINEKNSVIDTAKTEETKSKADDIANNAELEKKAEKEAEKELAKKEAEEKAKLKAEEEKRAKELEEAKKKQQEEAKKAESKTHTVQQNETLYRIAMNYYKDPSGVEKIKRANNLSSDNISVGQTLIIP